MKSRRTPPANSPSPDVKADPLVAHPPVAAGEIEQAIERAGARYAADLRALSEELTQGIGTAEPARAAPVAPAGEPERQPDALATPAAGADPAIDPPQSGRDPSPVALSPAARPPPRQHPRSDRSPPPSPPWWHGVSSRRAHRTKLVPVVAILLALAIAAAAFGRGLLISTQRDSAANTMPIATSSSAGDRSGPVATASSALDAAPVPTLALPTPVPSAPPSPAVPTPLPSAPPPSAVPTPLPIAPSLVAVAPTPTIGQRPTPSIYQRVVNAEAELRTGEFEILAEYGPGSRSLTKVRFDLGDAQHPPRLHSVTTYHGVTGSRIVERIMIGDQSWQRGPDGRWTAVPTGGSMQEQVHAFLPGAGSVADLVREGNGTPAVLRWYDVGRDADVTLSVDSATGLPRQLRRVLREGGFVVTVTYSGWNTPVDIAQPNLP